MSAEEGGRGRERGEPMRETRGEGEGERGRAGESQRAVGVEVIMRH